MDVTGHKGSCSRAPWQATPWSHCCPRARCRCPSSLTMRLPGSWDHRLPKASLHPWLDWSVRAEGEVGTAPYVVDADAAGRRGGCGDGSTPIAAHCATEPVPVALG